MSVPLFFGSALLATSVSFSGPPAKVVPVEKVRITFPRFFTNPYAIPGREGGPEYGHPERLLIGPS